jgi:hypothetical protein
VYYWSASGQGTVGHPMGTPVEDFPVSPGYPYYVNVTSATTWPSGGEQSGLAGSINAVEGLAQGRNKGLVAGKVPHTVYGKLISSDDVDLTDNRLKLRAWVTGHPNNILTDENIGVGCDGEYWWVGVSNFANNWNVGDSLNVEIIDPVGGLRGEAMVVLTAAGSDKADPIRFSATTSVVGVELTEIPAEFILLPNYPNPFNPETKISFGLPKSSHVKIRIYDISGRLVRNLVNRVMDSGYHQVIWNGQDNNGEQGSSGVYLCRMETSGYQKILKLVFAK